jgi:hypothetical protein
VGGLLALSQPSQQTVQVGLGVAPIEGNRGLLIAVLEGEQTMLDLGEVGEVVGVSTLRWITEK